MHFRFYSFHRYFIFFLTLFFFLFLINSLLEMEFEIYESELADYSLQDSPFYEANTPIIFGSSAQSIFASNNSASMVDALNLSSKKSSIMMSAKCQSHKLGAYERTTNGNAIGKTIDGIDAPDTPSKKHRSESTERFYSTKNADLDTNATENNIQPKKKRKCVSFLPTNYVQVHFLYLKILFFCVFIIFVFRSHLRSNRN